MAPVAQQAQGLDWEAGVVQGPCASSSGVSATSVWSTVWVLFLGVRLRPGFLVLLESPWPTLCHFMRLPYVKMVKVDQFL